MKANDTKASETIADIVKELRQCGNYAIYRKPIFSEPGAVSDLYVKKFFYGQWLTDYGTIKVERPKIQEVGVFDLADRIEAAAKREAQGRREVMNIEELEAIADAMAEEGGDQIDALYDTVTLQKDQYCGFICRLREVVRQMKLHNEDRKAAVGSGNSTTAGPGASPSVLETVEVYHNPPNAVNAAAMRKALENIVKVGYPHNFQHEAPHISGYCYEITDAITKCFEALAAPPRNCDLPEVAEGQPIDLAEQAWRVFKRSHKDSYLDAYGLLRCIGWLFAPATEQKGCNDGSK